MYPFTNDHHTTSSSTHKSIPHLISLLRVLSKETLALALILLKASKNVVNSSHEHYQMQRNDQTDAQIVGNMSNFLGAENANEYTAMNNNNENSCSSFI